MVDIEAATGYVVAHGDPIDRARLAWLDAGSRPSADTLLRAEEGQLSSGGWAPLIGSGVASIDATCFRLGELDDLGALDRPAARRALAWLAGSQRVDGRWEEDQALADQAPAWARPGDPEAQLFLTANATFWLAVSGPPPGMVPAWGQDAKVNPHAEVVSQGAEALRAVLRPDGSWPSYLATGWLGGALLYYLGSFYEAAQIQVALAERVPQLSPADTAWLGATMRRVGVAPNDWLMVAVARRLSQTQRSDGGWDNDGGGPFAVHTTLTAIRALR